MDDPTKSMPVGLAKNRPGIAFKCGDCQFFKPQYAECWNENPRLHGKHVEAAWCCNLFRHPGMRVVIR